MKKDKIKIITIISALILIIMLLFLVIIMIYKNNTTQNNINSYKKFSKSDYPIYSWSLNDNDNISNLEFFSNNNNFKEIKLNNKSIKIGYNIYQVIEENYYESGQKGYSYYLQFLFNDQKIGLINIGEYNTELRDYYLDKLEVNKIIGLDNKEYLTINANVNSTNSTFIINDNAELVYIVPLVSEQEIELNDKYNIEFNDRVSINNNCIYYLSQSNENNKAAVHKVTLYDNKYYDEVIDTINAKFSGVKQ